MKLSEQFKECLLGLLCYHEDTRLSLDELDANPYLRNFSGEEYDHYMVELNKKHKTLVQVMKEDNSIC
jgi:hypothetical protein